MLMVYIKHGPFVHFFSPAVHLEVPASVQQWHHCAGLVVAQNMYRTGTLAGW